jgi:hypothetical protein
MFIEKLKTSKLKNIGAIVATILLISFTLSTLDTWTNMWHEFGENLYQLFNA